MSALMVATLATSGCGDDGPAGPGDLLAGGVLATFSVEGEPFRVWTDNADVVADLQALEAGTTAATIPNGVLRRGAGRGDHNTPWTWHLDPTELEMAELTTEVCSARPSHVEENLDEWVDVVGRYCPWSAELVQLDDHR